MLGEQAGEENCGNPRDLAQVHKPKLSFPIKDKASRCSRFRVPFRHRALEPNNTRRRTRDCLHKHKQKAFHPQSFTLKALEEPQGTWFQTAQRQKSREHVPYTSCPQATFWYSQASHHRAPLNETPLTLMSLCRKSVRGAFCPTYSPKQIISKSTKAQSGITLIKKSKLK